MASQLKEVIVFDALIDDELSLECFGQSLGERPLRLQSVREVYQLRRYDLYAGG